MSFSEWREVRLGDVCTYASTKVSVSEVSEDNYISTENMLPNKSGVTKSSGLPTVGSVTKYSAGNVLVSNIRPYFRKIWYADRDGGCSNDVLVFDINDSKTLDSKFLFYCLSNDVFFDYVMAGSKGTKMPRGDKGAIMKYPVLLPSLPEQKAIAATLSALDDMIELNNQINKTLEEMAQAIFKSWFVDFEPFKDGEFEESELGLIPKGWRVAALDEIATYLNGLAMQKYPPSKNERGLPVLKIKELRQGFTDGNSDICSESIDNSYIINDGDIIFSWSGSLLVDIWCGGRCGLNQHLFKVTSASYNKWFYYMWTRYHLERFIAIAKDKATTMGHIQRKHLSEAKVLIPEPNTLAFMDSVMQPIIDLVIANKVENKTLSTIRDTLLPKLMSGEIRVPVGEVM